MFVDKRLGEYNSNVSLEEKMLKRFALEQQVWQTAGRYLRPPFHTEAQGEGSFRGSVGTGSLGTLGGP